MLLAGTFAPTARAQAPLTIGFPGAERPFWVDARVAFEPDGTLNPLYFGDVAADGLAEELANAPGDCVQMGMTFVDYVDMRVCDDFDCAVRSAELIVRGEVAGRTFGFNDTEAGQLLEIRPDEVLKGSWSGGSLFAFYPVASFCAGGRTICKTDERWPASPGDGCEVFVFSGYKPWANGWVQTEYEEDIVPVSSDGFLRFGRRSRMAAISGPRTEIALENQIHSVLETREQRLQHASDPEAAPYLLYFSGNAYPEWVDARVALLPDGDLDPSLFRPEMFENATRALAPQSTSNPTIRIGETDPRPSFIMDACTLDESVRESSFVVLSRVTGRTFGFRWGIPGQLLRVETVRDYRGTGMVNPAYLFLPVGDFVIGGRRIVKTDSRYAPPPVIGDEVFLFTYPASRSNIVHPLEGRGYVPVSPGGDLMLGTDYRAGEESSVRPLRTKQDLIDRVSDGSS